MRGPADDRESAGADPRMQMTDQLPNPSSSGAATVAATGTLSHKLETCVRDFSAPDAPRSFRVMTTLPAKRSSRLNYLMRDKARGILRHL